MLIPFTADNVAVNVWHMEYCFVYQTGMHLVLKNEVATSGKAGNGRWEEKNLE